jgi:hypothetical protein
MDTTIRDLAAEAHSQFERYESHNRVLSKSIPVLYFGNLEAYRSSDLRVITVGSNPSDYEFRSDDGEPVEDPYWRFSSIGPPGGYSYDEYRDALGSYFDGSTDSDQDSGFEDGTDYGDWFKRYDRVLKGLGASYYDGAAHTALHTDLHSPLATCMSWSNLGDEAPDLKESLRAEGIPLWHRLVEALQPNVILASVAEKSPNHLEDIGFNRVGESEVVARLHRKKNGQSRKKGSYDVTAQSIQVGSEQATLVHGKKNVKPFLIGERQASGVGQAIRCYIEE